MRSIENSQYEYIGTIVEHYSTVAARLDPEFIKKYHLPKIELVEDESSTRMLVLSPHEDDEVLGCGGTMRRVALAGGRIKVLYMTDGRFGNMAFSPKIMPDVRMKEAWEGLKILGVNEAHFNGAMDLGLVCDEKTVRAVVDQMKEIDANVLFVPHYNENHPDHWTTCEVAVTALELSGREMDVYEYEVWTSFIPNTLVDITDVMDNKVEAIGKHQSQVQMIDYASKIRGLNAYRSINAVRNSKYCEAFVKSSAKDFIKKFRNNGHH